MKKEKGKGKKGELPLRTEERGKGRKMGGQLWFQTARGLEQENETGAHPRQISAKDTALDL